ncbi:MAG: hypothetical protein SGI92_22550 [Bryobacteraceae bacterium]|nr:hypothetical protein [Bryobacteraceae bacterium]
MARFRRAGTALTTGERVHLAALASRDEHFARGMSTGVILIALRVGKCEAFEGVVKMGV